jgi:hypothetical protein
LSASPAALNFNIWAVLEASIPRFHEMCEAAGVYIL